MGTIRDGLKKDRLDINLLGPPEISVGGNRIEVDTRKAIALLAYLAVEDSATRDRLASLFWGESNESRARAALRRTLSSLRRAVGPDHLDTDRLRIGLFGEATSDVAQFARAVAATAKHAHGPLEVCQECVPHLLEATSLYRRDFLEGFSIRDAPEFEDWARAAGEHYRLQTGEAFNRLAIAQAAAGNYSGAIESVSRWIELDPLHEPAHRQLMLLHAWAGDRPGAVAAYRSCVAVLEQELGVAPLEETIELHEAILDEDLPRAPGTRRRMTVAPAPARTITPADFINRNEELDVLRGQLAAASGGGRVAVVSGDPWMGKTRLVDEFIDAARHERIDVVKARGFRAERTLPYGVVVQILRSAPGLGEAPDWARREIARLVPGLVDGGDPPQESLGETLLFDAVVAVLSASHMVVWVDDAQWCDQASASLIGYLANRIEQTPCLLVISMRPADGPNASPFLELTRDGGKNTGISLKALSVEEVAAEISQPEQAETIVSQTGGVPLLVSAYLSEGEGGLGLGVQRLVQAHLAELSDLEQQILTTAAVLDGVCDLELLRTTSGRSEDEALEAVEHLARRDLLRISSQDGSVLFALEAVQHLIYERASVVRRRLLHRRAARLLEERSRVSADAPTVAAIAHHLQLSGSEPEAATWYLRAADLAMMVYAHQEAEASYRLAQALGHPEKSRIRLALARLYMLTSRYREALTEYETVTATSEDRDRASAEHGIGEIHRRLGRLDVAADHFRLAEQHHPQPGHLYADWALLAHRQGDDLNAVDLAKRSLTAAADDNDLATTARAHHLLGVITPDREKATPHFEKALTLAEEDPAQRMASLNGLAWAIGRGGDPAAARPLVEEALELAERIGDRHRQAALLNHLADLHHQTGDDACAEELVTESARLFAEIEPDAWEPEIWLLTRW